jgi:hypothetical protein
MAPFITNPRGRSHDTKRSRYKPAVQFDSLERIAAFAAKVRGHQLTGWKRSRYSATAACAACNRTVTVYLSLLQPEMQGAALEGECLEQRTHEAA